jgi:CRISPR-associated protein Cas5d
MKGPIHALEVWGDFACFSRPDMGKVERWSYPCPTPSSVRGVFDAIYSKPNRDVVKAEFRWQVTKIELLAMPAYIALRRNEVKDTANVNAVYKWMTGEEPPDPIWADGDKGLLGSDEKGRTQRQTMALREPRYRLHARIIPWPGFESQQKSFDEQFIRRASHGKCFQQPFFGCREFVAYFKVKDISKPQLPPVAYDQDIGFMLYDVFDLSRPGTSMDKPLITLFRATIQQGVLNVPPFDSDLVLKPGKLAKGGPADA